MSEFDYKDYQPEKYPDPLDRLAVKDFPAEDELFTYGVGIPVPTSREELRCTYNEDDRNPLRLEDLVGYKVPPFGLKYVAKHGGGGKQGFIYKPGTFRQNRSTFGMELGVTPDGANLIRESKRQEAVIDGIIRAFDKNEIEYSGNTPADVLGTLTFVTLDRLLDKDAPVKELRLAAFTDILKVLTTKEETVERARENVAAQMGMKNAETLDVAIKALTELIADKKGEVIDAEDGEFYDVSEEGEESMVDDA